MFVEGKIDQRYLEVLLAAGYEPDWVCNTSKEAAEKGYELELNDDDVVVRIWIDMDTEDFFKPEDLIFENKKLLALMATVGHEGLREFAEKELKK
jgi:endo-1,4-beta-D-glucanase Y